MSVLGYMLIYGVLTGQVPKALKEVTDWLEEKLPKPEDTQDKK